MRGLARRSAIGGLVVILAQGVRFVLNIGSLVIMARLLSPADFGLIAMVAPLVRLASILQDLSTATVHRQTITAAQISTLVWFNIGVSVLLAALMALIAPIVAAFYGAPQLFWVTVSFGATIICGGLAAQHLALLQRQMRFTTLSAIEIAALAVGICAGIVAALSGLAYWSLVLMAAGTSMAMMILAWLTSGWKPGRPVRDAEIRSMISFGSQVTISALCHWLTRNIDNVLIGKVWGETALGIYSRAYGLLLLPMSQLNHPITRVAVPTLSRLQDDLPRYREYYLTSIGLLVTVGMPLVAYMAVDAELLVLLVLGEQWRAAVPIFQVLAPAAYVGTFNIATSWVYTSLGQTGRQLRWAVFQTPVIIGSLCIGLPFGPIGVAIAFSTASVALRFAAIAYCFKYAPLKPVDLYIALMPAGIASLAAAGGLIAIEALVPETQPGGIISIPIRMVIYGSLYAVIYLAIPRGRRQLGILFRVLRQSRLV